MAEQSTNDQVAQDDAEEESADELVGEVTDPDVDFDPDGWLDEGVDEDEDDNGHPHPLHARLRGVSFHLAPSLVRLRDEVDRRWPNRDKASDGWIGDPSHSSRTSDHNPDYSAGGVVRALDIDVDGINAREVLKALIGDRRVWYVIHNYRIYSRSYGWRARRYNGSNPHTTHIHVSIRHDRDAETDTARWLNRRTKGLPGVNLDAVRRQARDPDRSLPGVKRIQRALNARYDVGLEVDGVFGSDTRAAYRTHERKINAPKVDGIPGRASLTRLGRGRFRVDPPRS